MTFLKSYLLGLKRRIGEPIMILLTVAIAVAIFLSALTLGDSVEKTLTSSYRALSGSAEIEASFSEEYDAYYAMGDGAIYSALEEASEKYGKLHAGYLFYASIGGEERSFAEVYATDREALAAYNPIDFLSGELALSRTGVVLGASFAERIGASVGDTVIASRYGSAQSVTLTVSGVAKETGLFTEVNALLSEEAASRLLSLGDSVRVYNRFFIELSEEKMKAQDVTEGQVIALIEEAAPSFTLASPVNDRNVKVSLSYQRTLLLVIAAIVAALGAALIYTAVSLVMKSRLSFAALFKSVGASNAHLTLYLLGEILLYGLVGSLLGVAGSYGVAALFGAMTGTAVTFTLGFATALIGVLFGAVLSLLSALIPVLKLSFSPLYDLLHAHSPILKIKGFPALLASTIFVAFFLAVSFAGVSAAFILGVFAFFALLATLFTVTPFAIKGFSVLLCKVTRDRPRAGKLYLAASGARSNRHAQSGARLLAIAVLAVVSIAVLIGESTTQLGSFDRLFKADVMISADSLEIPTIAAEARNVEGVTGAYFAYVETRCALENEEENTVSVFAARAQEYESVFRAAEFGVDVPSLVGGGKAAMGGGLALKLGLEIGDSFAVTLDGKRTELTLVSLIDTPLTVVFTDLTGLGISPNLCLVEGTDEAYTRLSEKYALTGAVYRASDAFGYVTELAEDYIRVFALFEALVFLFAAAGYLNGALASYRDRKREYELLTAAGASRGDKRRIIAAENGIVVLTATLLGGALSFALLFVVQNMLKTLGLYFTLLG